MSARLIVLAVSVVFAVLVVGLTVRVPLRSIEGNLVSVESDEHAYRWPLAGVVVCCSAIVMVVF